jgi:SAM-dependent methyltransferase
MRDVGWGFVSNGTESEGLGVKKLQLGCGNQRLPGWVNHDIAPLPGVDVVHDLEIFPWPFEDGAYSEIRMINVLEHLSDTVRVLEELYRISAPGARICIRVPYWNSRDMATDPTHKSFFSEYSFDYFDPSTPHGKDRPYYSTARFRIEKKHFYGRVALFGFIAYPKVSFAPFQAIMSAFAQHLCGVIWAIEFDLVALKG